MTAKKNVIPGPTFREKLELRYRERFLLFALQENRKIFQDYKELKILKRLQDLDLIRDGAEGGQKYTARGQLVRSQLLKNIDLSP